MKLSCMAHAFNIRKRKQFREKDADLASLSLWGRKNKEVAVKAVEILGFVQMEKGQRSSSVGMKVQIGA